MSGKNPRQRQRQARVRPIPKPDKRPIRQTSEQILIDLTEQFYLWSMSLRTKVTFEFDLDEENNHRCKMTLPIFPNLQSIGNGANSKKESKANAIIAFLAHMEKRKEVGLFVPYVIPTLLRHIQVELRRACVSPPDMHLNRKEFLLMERIITKNQAKKSEPLMRTIERVCQVRVIILWQSAAMTFVYVVGAKDQEESIRPFAKAVFEPDHEQVFHYGEKLFDVFKDQMFLDNVCQCLKVLCTNHLEKCRLLIRGSSVNVQCCYNEFVTLRREFESEFYRNQQLTQSQPPILPGTKPAVPIPSEHLESTRIDQEEKLTSEEKESDQLPDYSVYDDEVNASILRVLRHEDGGEEDISDEEEAPVKKSPTLIEISDDSIDSTDLTILQTVLPKPATKTDPLPPLMPEAFSFINLNASVFPVAQSFPPRPLLSLPLPQAIPAPQGRILRHIVLDGQNIARNSNDNARSFSWLRLSNAINYFKSRGHENIIAFLPLYLRDFLDKHVPKNQVAAERKIRDGLINSRLIAFTPSRYNNGQRLTNYDDRFILQYAADNDGVVVSNDNFRDLQHEKTFQFVINQRILPFATINDTFMPATDPLGRNGPHLDDFLCKMPPHGHRRL